MTLNIRRSHLLFALLAATSTACFSATVQEPACDTQAVSFDMTSAIQDVQSQLPSTVQPLGSLCGPIGISSSDAMTLQGMSFQFPPLTTSTQFDFSSDLSKISDVAKELTVSVSKLSLANMSGEMDFVSHVEVDIVGSDTSAFPMVELATYDATSTMPAVLNFQVKLTADKVASYLEAGQITLTFTLDSNPISLQQVCSVMDTNGTDLSSTIDMCVDASGSFSKKL